MPEVRHRPTRRLASTGSDVEDALWLGVSLLLVAYRPARR